MGCLSGYSGHPQPGGLVGEYSNQLYGLVREFMQVCKGFKIY